MKNQKENKSVFSNLQSWVIERTNPKTSYVIVDSPYHFGHYVFQGTRGQCETFIEAVFAASGESGDTDPDKCKPD